MILLYHKVDLEAKTGWWVTADSFYRQMYEIRRRKVVPLEGYNFQAEDQVVITFDGVYENVYKFAFPILKRFGYPFELFVIGDYIGKDNAFDSGEPRAKFCSRDQLREMVASGGRLQWHTRSHSMKDEGLERSIPDEVRDLDPKGFNWFAPPHGTMVERVRPAFAGFIRFPMVENLHVPDAPRSTVSVIIPNHNYGRFLDEAVGSVLNQTIPADEVLIIDDFSTDASHETMEKYHGSRVKLVYNDRNLGPVQTFNKAVRMSEGEYVCLVGADNLIRCDYVEKCRAFLDDHPGVGVVGTDALTFGPLAPRLAGKLRGGPDLGFRVHQIGQDRFVWSFPAYDPEIMGKRNLIHGSAMFRREAFDQAGGYVDNGKHPEDWLLWKAMIGAGWKPGRIEEPLLEYRQHSRDQRNYGKGEAQTPDS